MKVLFYALLCGWWSSYAGPLPAAGNPECPVYLPNVFSPNGDGVNDTILPMLGECDIAGYQFQVFTRWGQLIFESTQPGEGWNGRIKGGEAPQDLYTLIVRITFREEAGARTEFLTQSVNLLR